LLSSEVEEESEAVVVSTQGFFALALLVFALKKLKLGEPLKDSISDLTKDMSFEEIVLVNREMHCLYRSISGSDTSL
jgi:hypothetical protein